MERNEIIDILDAYIRDRFEVEEDDSDYSVDVHLFDYGYVDSLGATELVQFVEDRFGLKITQKDITLYPMNTVREIAEVVSDKLNGEK